MNQRGVGKWFAALMAGTVIVLVGGQFVAATTGEPSLKLVQTIELQGKAGKLDHLFVDGKSQRLFLANKVNNTLDIVDLKAGKLVKQVTGQGGAQGVVYAPDLDRIFVALGSGGYCNVFDGKSYNLVKTVKFADDADNIRYNPLANRIYVAHAESSLGVIDAKSYEIKADIKLPGPAEAFQLDPAGKRLYVNAPGGAEVTVIDTDKNEIVNRFKIKSAGANYTMALDVPNKRLFIGCRKEPMVVVMDMDTGKEITTVAIPRDNDDLFFDAKRKRIYASCGEGFLAVIDQMDANNYKLREKIATVPDAKTSFYDAESSKLYLAAPRPKDKKGPEIRVYQAN